MGAPLATSGASSWSTPGPLVFTGQHQLPRDWLFMHRTPWDERVSPPGDVAA